MNQPQPIIEQRGFEFYRSGRSLAMDEVAREQAILNHVNGDDSMSAEEAANLNEDRFRNRRERTYFKHQFVRHTRNIAEGNRFY